VLLKAELSSAGRLSSQIRMQDIWEYTERTVVDSQQEVVLQLGVSRGDKMEVLLNVTMVLYLDTFLDHLSNGTWWMAVKLGLSH
jgi:hypothetical protein